MITLIGDSPEVAQFKRFLEDNNQESQMITMFHALDTHNKEAKIQGIRQGSIFSMWDIFKGRTEVQERILSVEDFEIPEGYYFNENDRFRLESDDKSGKYIKLFTFPNGSLAQVIYHEGDDRVIKREIYDDGGWLQSVQVLADEKEIDEESNITMFHTDGSEIFEYRGIGPYRYMANLRYIPKNIKFETEEKFFYWAMKQLLQTKKPEDKIIIFHDKIREILSLIDYDYNKEGVYLLSELPLGQLNYSESGLNRFEKVIFNNQYDLEEAQKNHLEKARANLYWNNYKPADFIRRNFTGSRRIYFLIENVEKAQQLKSIIEDMLNFDENVKIMIQEQDNNVGTYFVENMQEELKERMEIINFWYSQEVIKDYISQSDFYVYYGDEDVIVPDSLMYAIGARLPIFALSNMNYLGSYITDNNGKFVALEQITTVIKRAMVIPNAYMELAEDPKKHQEYFSSQETWKRWEYIFNDKEIQL